MSSGTVGMRQDDLTEMDVKARGRPTGLVDESTQLHPPLYSLLSLQCHVSHSLGIGWRMKRARMRLMTGLYRWRGRLYE